MPHLPVQSPPPQPGAMSSASAGRPRVGSFVEHKGATIFRRRELGEQEAAAEPEELMALSAEEYMDRFNVRCYLCDVVQHLLDSRDDRPLEFIAEYFIAVTRGTHVTQRSYSFVTATLHNRRAFAGVLNMVAASFAAGRPQQQPKEGSGGEESAPAPAAGSLSFADALQVVQLACPDLPSVLFSKVYRAQSFSYPITPVDFTVLCAALGIEVYYNEHLAELRHVWDRSCRGSEDQLIRDLQAVQPRNRQEPNFYGVQSRLAAVPPELLAEAARAALRKHGDQQAKVAGAAGEAACAAALAAVTVLEAEDPGLQVFLPHPPPREPESPTAEAEAAARAGSPADCPSDLFCSELYRSGELAEHMSGSHPLLADSLSASLEELVSGLLQAHDQTVLSWRRRRQKRNAGRPPVDEGS
eukprot:TRINITY_DN1924_c2_g1_i1.p1 TRINITY_DN1924_c2_g1~~TRINITY_DN1924_c2_g1_i1.p1  ORF type:complete len:413 (+),score=139.17 TRINITY_DN1924_c2_g1_i1:32-1270(+)